LYGFSQLIEGLSAGQKDMKYTLMNFIYVFVHNDLYLRAACSISRKKSKRLKAPSAKTTTIVFIKKKNPE
jgi:hypothetical protein